MPVEKRNFSPEEECERHLQYQYSCFTDSCQSKFDGDFVNFIDYNEKDCISCVSALNVYYILHFQLFAHQNTQITHRFVKLLTIFENMV